MLRARFIDPRQFCAKNQEECEYDDSNDEDGD